MERQKESAKRKTYHIDRIPVSFCLKGKQHFSTHLLHVVSIEGQPSYLENPVQSGALFWFPPIATKEQREEIFKEIFGDIEDVAPKDAQASAKAMDDFIKWQQIRYGELIKSGLPKSKATAILKKEGDEKFKDLNETVFKPISIQEAKMALLRKRTSKTLSGKPSTRLSAAGGLGQEQFDLTKEQRIKLSKLHPGKENYPLVLKRLHQWHTRQIIEHDDWNKGLSPSTLFRMTFSKSFETYVQSRYPTHRPTNTESQ